MFKVHTELQDLGTYSDIAGVKCYIATPSGEYDKTKVVFYFTDAFGLELVNNRVRSFSLGAAQIAYSSSTQLLADDFARNGYKVVAPDFFEGEPVHPDLFETVRASCATLPLDLAD